MGVSYDEIRKRILNEMVKVRNRDNFKAVTRLADLIV